MSINSDLVGEQKMRGTRSLKIWLAGCKHSQPEPQLYYWVTRAINSVVVINEPKKCYLSYHSLLEPEKVVLEWGCSEDWVNTGIVKHWQKFLFKMSTKNILVAYVLDTKNIEQWGGVIDSVQLLSNSIYCIFNKYPWFKIVSKSHTPRGEIKEIDKTNNKNKNWQRIQYN
jgi:hypothetical protein